MRATLTVTSQPAPQVGLSLAVALDTKSHVESFTFQSIHLLDLTVARFTSDFLLNVSHVVEQHVLGQLIDFHPRGGGTAVILVMFFLDLWMIGDDVVVAVQTFFYRWQSRV